MESAPNSRENYEKTEQDIHRVKSEITGDKSKEEIATLVEEREQLVAELEAEKSRAEDDARGDNANLDDARAKIEKLTAEIDSYKNEIAEITGVTEEERESIPSPELARIRDAGYLDTSFEGKEIHRTSIGDLSKEEALDRYKKSGGATWVWDELEKNMPYVVPNAENLDVMIINFNKYISSDDAIKEMDALGVRPLTYEELIQYGIAHPSHQEQKALIGLGSKHALVGNPHAPVLDVNGVGERSLDANHWGVDWVDRYRFPVARK